MQPLIRPDGTRILILRGWTPADITLQPVESTGKLVQLTGVLRRSEDAGGWVKNPTLQSSGAADSGTSTRHTAVATADADAGSAPVASAQRPHSSKQRNVNQHPFIYFDVPAIARACGLDERRGDQVVMVEALSATEAAYLASSSASSLTSSASSSPSASSVVPAHGSAVVGFRPHGATDNNGLAAARGSSSQSSPSPSSSQAVTYPLPRSTPSLYESWVMPQTHLTYAFTWYALSICGTILTYQRYRGGAAGAGAGSSRGMRGARKLAQAAASS